MKAERLFWLLVKFDHIVRQAQIWALIAILTVPGLLIGLKVVNPFVGFTLTLLGWYGLVEFGEWYEGFSDKPDKPRPYKQPQAISQNYEEPE